MYIFHFFTIIFTLCSSTTVSFLGIRRNTSGNTFEIINDSADAGVRLLDKMAASMGTLVEIASRAPLHITIE